MRAPFHDTLVMPLSSISLLSMFSRFWHWWRGSCFEGIGVQYYRRFIMPRIPCAGQVYMRYVRESPSFSSTYARGERCSRLSVFLRELCATGATSHSSLTSNTVTTSALCNSAPRFPQSHCPTFQNQSRFRRTLIHESASCYSTLPSSAIRYPSR